MPFFLANATHANRFIYKLATYYISAKVASEILSCEADKEKNVILPMALCVCVTDLQKKWLLRPFVENRIL